MPSNVQLAVFADVGTRDETAETSGATQLLKNAYLKTSINTNETVNYGIVQMAGGEFEAEYGRESGFYRVNCLSHDVIDVFSMLVDCALEPRNYVGCAIGRMKNNEAHDLDNLTGGNQRFNDSIFATAYGNKSLGNSILGNKTNVGNLSAEVIQKFQQQNFTNDRIVISATGIENHEEFVDLVRDKMNLTQLGSSKAEREAAKYTGGEIRSLVDSSVAHVALAFEGANYGNAWTLMVANEILDSKCALMQATGAQAGLRRMFCKMCSLTTHNPSPVVSLTLDCLDSNSLDLLLM